MTRLESNTTAVRNGKEMEKNILLYMGLPFEGQPVDSTPEGHPLEVKSCQVRITDAHNSNSSRSGRFILEPDQFRYLKENDGIYVFIVHENFVVHHSWMIRADLVPLTEFSANRSVPWTTARRWLN